MTEILICESDELMRLTLERWLGRRGFKIHSFDHADPALAWLAAHPGVAQIVIADHSIAGGDGAGFLRRAAELDASPSRILIVGVNGYKEAAQAIEPGTLIRLKPFDVEDLLGTVADAERLWAGRDAEAAPDRRVRQLAARMGTPLDAGAILTLEALLAAYESRHPAAEWHSRRISQYAVRIASELEMAPAALLELEWAALFHDIGLIGVRDSILDKPGPLDAAEWREVRRHPDVGSRLLGAIPALAGAAAVIAAHHERWDGGGYPRGCAKEEVYLGARVLAVADFYDTVTSERPYGTAQSPEEARDQLWAASGVQFDPYVVDAFLAIPLEELALIRKSQELVRLIDPRKEASKIC